MTVDNEKVTDPAEEAAAPIAEPQLRNRRPRKVYDGMWGPVEIGAVAASLLILAASIAVYLFLTAPSERELAKAKAENDRLEAEVASARAKYGEIKDTQTQVDTLVASVDDFEARFLPAESNGRSAIYQRLNALIRAYGLVNTSGPDYAPLEPIGKEERRQQTEEEKGRARFRSLYPGIYITTTLEGSYQNLRRFIRDVETGREFLLISSIELAPAESAERRRDDGGSERSAAATAPNSPSGGAAFPPGANIMAAPQPRQETPRSQQGRMLGQVVSLRIEMAAYFRRPGGPEAASAQ
jgi:Tfp pilus assembly protein PilO